MGTTPVNTSSTLSCPMQAKKAEKPDQHPNTEVSADALGNDLDKKNDWLINCYFKMDVNNSINNNNRHKILPNTSN